MQQLDEISREQLLKWHKGNDIWAMVVLSTVTKSKASQEKYMINGIPPVV
jgi:hypothetical protein